MRVTVLGGKGLLGRHLVPLLTENGHDVTVTTRDPAGELEARADFTTGEGIEDAIDGEEVIVHLVSDARKPTKTDIEGTKRLLGVMDGQHLLYISIVGVDRHPFAYYRAKHEVERLIGDSGVDHTILRATQFHDFVAYFIGAACRPPVALIPKRFVFQPIDTAEVASELARLVETRSPGLQPDMAGPIVHDAEYLARSLMNAKGRERPILNLPVPGRVARAFRDGAHTNPERAVGKRTWDDYLEQFRGL